MDYEERWQELKYELEVMARHYRKQLEDGFTDNTALLKYGNAIAYEHMLEMMEDLEKEDE